MFQKEQTMQAKLSRLINALPGKDKEAVQANLSELKKEETGLVSKDHASQQLYLQVQQTLPMQKIAEYRQLKTKLKENEDIIKIVTKGKLISQLMQEFTAEKRQIVEQDYLTFIKLLTALNTFEQTALNIQASINYITLRQQLYLQMLGKLNKAIQGSDVTIEIFQKIIKQNNLPLKKDQTRKQGMSPQNRDFFLYKLYRQSSLNSIKRYLLGLLEKEDKGNEESILSIYWQSVCKAVSYLFISHAQLRNPEEPAWMFEYLQQVLNDNYKYLIEFICRKDLRQEINTTVSRHFLHATFNTLFLQTITKRFQEDLPGSNEFLIFNFIDQLGKFEDKLASSFSIRPCLVETLILRFDNSHQILSKALQYQEKWFTSKIFEEFVNIDYSKINLKNLDAFNIVSSFLSLFQRLRQKYINIQQVGIGEKINKFYEKQILNLIAHVKTSFDRIYNHSKLPKIDVLLSFKRVEKELRANLVEFLSTQPQLEDNLQREYYAFLEQYFEVCALEAVTPTHKKLHISLGDIMDYLCSEEENQHDKYLNAFGKIFEEWEAKIEQIHKFASYSDNKVRAIFFKYLEATSFSSVGLNLYLKIFQPYLRVLFAEDRHRALIAMITMGRKAFNEYIESHSESLTFLTAQERKQLQVFKKTVSIE